MPSLGSAKDTIAVSFQSVCCQLAPKWDKRGVRRVGVRFRLAARPDFSFEAQIDTNGSAALPSIPDLKGQSVQGRWNAVHLAYLGDSVWELCIRNYFFSPPLRLADYYTEVQKLVRAEAQAALFDHLLCSDALSEQELSILQWGKNAKVKTPKRLTINHQQGTYKKATAMECLVGYLYLTSVKRLDELMQHLLSQQIGVINGSEESASL